MVRKPGRKIDTLKIDGFDPVEIRFVSENSFFTADFLGKWFSDKDLNVLKDAMRAEAAACAKTVWKPVIVITYSRWDYEQKVTGFRMEKYMLGSTSYPDGTIKNVLAGVAVVNPHAEALNVNNWRISNTRHDWKGDTPDERIIDYTPERYLTLELIENRMKELKAMLKDVLSGDNCVNFIDTLFNNRGLFLRDEFTKTQLLPAAGKEP